MLFRSAEQARFSDTLLQHITQGTAPLLLEGGTGLGKTRAYLHALVTSGKRVAIILPTHQLIDQLLDSSDILAVAAGASIAAFRPTRWFDDPAAYAENKQAAQAAQVLLCTASSVMLDQRLSGGYNGATLRDYLLFDEADQLPDLAALQTDVRLDPIDLHGLSPVTHTPAALIRELLATHKAKLLPETRAAARIMQELLEDPFSQAYARVGASDEGGLALLHKLPGRLIKQISNQANVAFISATLSLNGSFQDFKHAMGITRIDTLSAQIEPERHGSLQFFMDMQEVDTPEWLSAICFAIEGAAKPALVVTPSHELAQRIGALCPSAEVRLATETTTDAAARVAPDGVLIAAAAWAGLDTPLRWRSIIIPRVPYPQLQTLDGEVVSSYLSSRNTAVRRLRQVIGRGLRSPDAECQIVILDARAQKLSGFVPSRFQHNWLAQSWLEGGRYPVALSKTERDPRIRAAALRHYGHRCMRKGCPNKLESVSQLEVHHRDPIAEGERKTTLLDVMVLCACCHKLAHTRNPPYQLDIEDAPTTLLQTQP